MVTLAPARRRVSAVVRPMAPQPMTATRFVPPSSALAAAIWALPQDRDQPLPPWP